MLLFYLRHGDPIYEPDSLTPLGQRQAEALAHRLAVYGLDRIFASTSQRAKDTARPTCELLHMEYTELEWANESHAWDDFSVIDAQGEEHWPFESEEYIQLFASYEVRALGRNWNAYPAFRGTKLEKGSRRVDKETDAFFESLGYRHDREQGGYFSSHVNRQRLALFAHQGFGLAFLASLLDIPYPQFCTRFDMSHSGMTVVFFPEKEGFVVPKILQLSNDSHLYREGLPTCYQNKIRI